MSAVHFVNNPLFDVDVIMTYDNPLFELSDDPLQVLYDHDVDDVWDPICTPAHQADYTKDQPGLAEQFIELYSVRSAYSFTFDPHVQDIYQSHSSSRHPFDDWYGDLISSKTGSKFSLLVELLPCELLSVEFLPRGDLVTTSSVRVLSAVFQLLMLVLLMLLTSSQEYEVDRDITRDHPWDLGGL